MSKKNIDLNAAQKEEIRRLTQLANRRIKAATKAYHKAGKEIVPKEMVGMYQTSDQWHSKSTPMSRSVKFESQKAYREHLRFLKSFDPKAGGETRPGIREYTKVQRKKTLQAMKTSLGAMPPADIQKNISKMSAPQLADFWKVFSRKAAKMKQNYASDTNMINTIEDYFEEDMDNFRVEGA